MENPTLRTALLVVCATIGIIARATDCPLPTPPPSSYPDTESSANVAVTNWPSLGRRVKLTLSANFTPSNCVQIAFGQDTNADGDLAPEETHLILGVDCSEPFIRDESKSRVEVEQLNLLTCSAGQSEQETNHHCSHSSSIFAFRFKQPSAVSSRMNFAKVITRGRGNSAAEIAAEITRPGVALFIR